jgi:hypothetical protein
MNTDKKMPQPQRSQRTQRLKWPLLFALFAFFVVNSFSQTATLAWSPSPAIATYRLGIGTNSGNYVLTQNVTGTNATLNLSALFPGTNYLAVAAWQDNGGTNALLSPWSNEITVTRATAPALQINITISTSTNLVVWTGDGPTATAITSADHQFQFFRSGTSYASVAASGFPEPTGFTGAAQISTPLSDEK